jgi:WXXGXW repeat (2 copies)
MRTGLSISLLAAALLLALFTAGCVERQIVYVKEPPPPPGEPVPPSPQAAPTEAPPPPPVEIVGVAPGPAYYWVPGVWAWRGRWVWAPGRWVVRPHPHAAWVPGYWVHRRHGYVWVQGRWR